VMKIKELSLEMKAIKNSHLTKKKTRA